MTTGCVTVGDISMRYLTFGKGKDVLVILPGLSLYPVCDAAQAAADACREYGEHFTVYLFDRRMPMPVGYTLDGMAEDTYAVMRALELPPVFLLGTSQGGMIAMGLASKHPDAVRGLALASTACRVKPAFAQIYRHWVDLAKKGEALALATDFICRVYSDHIPLEIKASLIEANGNADRATLSRFAAMTESIDGLSEIICGGISCPVFVVGAESDRVFSQGETEELAKRLNAPCYLYRDGYGHAVYDETPDAHKRICAFFQSVRDGDYVQ